MQLLNLKSKHYYLILISSLVGLSGLFINHSLIGNKDTDFNIKESVWQEAVSLMGMSQFQDAFLVNFIRSDLLVKAQSRSIAWKFDLKGAPPMIAINFNIPKLCGSLGCLYAVYTKEKQPQLVGRFLLYPDTPKNIPIMSVSSDQLLINQVDESGKLAQISYKYDIPTKKFIYFSRQSLEIDKSN